MKKVISLCILTLSFVTLTSCSKKTVEQIFEDAAPGVVLILNEQYYSLEFADGTQLYFSGVEDGKIQNVTFDDEEIERNRNILFGTGFFVSREGEILTNRHVAVPELDKETVVGLLKKNFHRITEVLEKDVETYVHEYAELERQKSDLQSEADVAWYFGAMTEQDFASLDKQMAELDAKLAALRLVINEYTAALGKLHRLNYSALQFHSHSKVGIAYNGSFVSSSADFHPCMVKRVSQDEDADLALLQLKDKKTPETAYVFDVNAAGKSAFFDFLEGNGEELHVNDALYMIGYNAGIRLASTKQGIKAQLTGGNVSQEPDGKRLLYTVPTLAGSSGSPVLNDKGQLVAVNFAKVGDTQNFNFGIPVAVVKEFMGFENN